MRLRSVLGTMFVIAMACAPYVACASSDDPPSTSGTPDEKKPTDFLGDARTNGLAMIDSGREIFRFDTFGDEVFWTDRLHIQEAIAKLAPKDALDLGLKVDVDALPDATVQALRAGQVDLADPAVTASLVRDKAVLGVVGTFDSNGNLTRIGFSCALCHSTVDDSVTSGVGHRIDGLANRDLNVGAIVASAPSVQPIVDLLKLVDTTIDDAKVRTVLRSWGPGKYDAELLLDGKAFRPDGRTAAVLIPNARGLAGYNLEAWTGGWGGIPYWNAFVAVTQLHGVGTFFDERFDDATQFPVAAAAKLGHISVDPDADQVTSKLPALQVYQLALPAVKPRPGEDFDVDAAKRGDALFSGKARCNECHREPLWTEPGWDVHTPAEMKIDAFQADRAPDHTYKTMNLAGVFVRERGLFMRPENEGRFYHDGRFQTLRDVVDSYDQRFGLGLTDAEKKDLVEYLKSL